MDTSEKGSYGNHSAEPFDDDSLSSCFPEICDIYDESFPFPRVGEQYQVEIPPAETKSVLFQVSYDDTKMPAFDKFGIGLAIPVNWVQCAVGNIKIKCEKEDFSNVGIVGMKGSAHLNNTSSTQVDCMFNTHGSALENPELAGKLLQRFASNVEFLNSLHKDIHVAHPANHVMGDNDQKNYCFSLLQNRKLGDFYPLPGLPTLSWSDAEKQSFLLGLYIFGKNLVQVKKFMETKRMGDLLSFYYGKFYRSDEYHRWSECRKIRSRRSIHGQRIFRGWRQQELLSRISNSTCKEHQDTLLEAAKTFNEGRATLEKFVSKIKTAVGLQVLVEAIGIGKGTQDLTGVALDHVKACPTISLHPEIPVGRACSSLTSADIVKFLTGDFRLSKARSNDLFWEAVWPRLLARGWHSEQPIDHGSLGFKNSVVFLVPGVKKFSRKRLVKGTHFFDSVSDVLSKVASDPKLLELDVEGVKSGSSIIEENGWDVDAKVCRNGSFSNQQLHCYLHPRRLSCNSERMKFTVVDTSLVQREGSSFKVMVVRSLPLGDTSSYDPFADSQESRSESSSETEDSTDISNAEDDSNPGSFAEKKPEDNRTIQSEMSRTLIPIPNAATSNRNAHGDKRFVRLKDDTTVELRCQNSWRIRSGQSNCSAPTIKRRNLTACSRGTDRRTCSAIKNIQQDKQEKISKPVCAKAAGTCFPDASPFQEKTNLYNNFMSKEVNGLAGMNIPEDKLKSRTSFDLNNLPPDAVVAECSSNELKAEELPPSSAEKQHVGNEVSIQNSNEVPANEHPSTGIRRQSTRNRPPTAKALEALASGLLGTKRSWRPCNSTSRPTRKARKTYKDPASVAAANLGKLASSTLSMSVPEIVSKDYVESTSKGSRELLGVPWHSSFCRSS